MTWFCSCAENWTVTAMCFLAVSWDLGWHVKLIVWARELTFFHQNILFLLQQNEDKENPPPTDVLTPGYATVKIIVTVLVHLAMRFWGFLATFSFILLLTWWMYGGIWAFLLFVLAIMGMLLILISCESKRNHWLRKLSLVLFVRSETSGLQVW